MLGYDSASILVLKYIDQYMTKFDVACFPRMLREGNKIPVCNSPGKRRENDVVICVNVGSIEVVPVLLVAFLSVTRQTGGWCFVKKKLDRNVGCSKCCCGGGSTMIVLPINPPCIMLLSCRRFVSSGFQIIKNFGRATVTQKRWCARASGLKIFSWGGTVFSCFLFCFVSALKCRCRPATGGLVGSRLDYYCSLPVLYSNTTRAWGLPKSRKGNLWQITIMDFLELATQWLVAAACEHEFLSGLATKYFWPMSSLLVHWIDDFSILRSSARRDIQGGLKLHRPLSWLEAWLGRCWAKWSFHFLLFPYGRGS